MDPLSTHTGSVPPPPAPVRKLYRPSRPRQERFGGASAIGDDLVAKLLDREVAYDPELAYVCSVISGWSYADGQVLADRVPYYGLPDATVEEISVLNPALLIVSTAYFVRSACGRIGILSFRGTEPTNLINWLTDGDVQIRNLKGTGLVHQGFYENLQAIWDEIQDALVHASAANGHGSAHAQRPLEKLYVTGHSLGAAMAVLAAAKICRDTPHKVGNKLAGVYTFGQPAVGDETFARSYLPLFGDRLYRHAYACDVVPRLPPTSTGSFVHFGELRVALHAADGWQASSIAYRQAPVIGVAALSILASFVGRRIKLLGRLERLLCKYSLFDDHSPRGYIEASRATLQTA